MTKRISVILDDYDLKYIEELKTKLFPTNFCKKITTSDVIRQCIAIQYFDIKKTDENCIQQTSVHIANQKGE